MSALYHYPQEDLEAATIPHIKNKPYVKFRKTFMHHIFEGGSSRQEQKVEEHYFPLGSAPNIEALNNLMARGCKFISFGNFPNEPVYIQIASWLKTFSGMVLENTESKEYKELEAKILAKHTAGGAVAEKPVEALKADKKAKAEPKAEEVQPPEGL